MQPTVNLYRLSRRALRGFTLIELLIVVVVVAILAVVAYPAFQGQLRKSRRAEAVAQTALIQQAQERWRANRPQYAAVLMTLDPDDCDTEAERVLNNCLGIAPVAGARYTYALAGATATAYTLTATAVAGSSQAGDSGCTPLTVTVGAGSATRAPAACWSN